MRTTLLTLLGAYALAAASSSYESVRLQQGPPQTPAEIVATYNSLADAILAVKKTEHDLVLAMLAGTYRHAEVRMNLALAKIKAGQPANEDVEAVAALVSQLGNEGDNSVAGIRKRLLDGGHHHNAAGEAQGIFDEGFVIVTKEAKKSFLDSALAIGKSKDAPTADGLSAEWAKVKATWEKVPKGSK